jgi:hypothetical protein
MGEMLQITAHHSRLSPPWVANKASRATSGRHLTVPQDEVRQDREHGFARGALDTPDGETTQPDAGIMGVACQAPAAVTARFMLELKAKGQEKGEDTLDKGLRVAKQLKVGGFILKINGDGAVFTSRFGWACHGSPAVQMSVAVEETP